MNGKNEHMTKIKRLIIAFTLLSVAQLRFPFACSQELPSEKQILDGHVDLREAAKRVEGVVKVFRAELLLPIDVTPQHPDMILQYNGYLWRDGKKYRINYSSEIPRAGGQLKVNNYAVARDGDTAFEFSGGGGVADVGMLRVYERGSQDGKRAIEFASAYFISNVDILWAGGDTAVTSLFQRPGYSLSQADDKSRVLVKVPVKGQDTKLFLSSSAPFEFSRYDVTSNFGNVKVNVQKHAFPRGTLPSRVITVAELGPGEGYTELVELDLRPIGDKNPISGEITSSSFKDMNSSYQIYNIKSSNKETIGQRHNQAITMPGRSRGGYLTLFLSINGFIAIVIACWILYKKMRK